MDFRHSSKLYNQSVAKGTVNNIQPKNTRMGTSKEVLSKDSDSMNTAMIFLSWQIVFVMLQNLLPCLRFRHGKSWTC